MSGKTPAFQWGLWESRRKQLESEINEEDRKVYDLGFAEGQQIARQGRPFDPARYAEGLRRSGANEHDIEVFLLGAETGVIRQQMIASQRDYLKEQFDEYYQGLKKGIGSRAGKK
ncbi:MAG: hypothetical protein ACYCOU_10020 [Sulfobacillus sp.]